MTTPEQDYLMEAIYRALTRYDREKRRARDLRMASGGGPTIKRGTGRSALALYLTDAVLTAQRELRESEA